MNEIVGVLSYLCVEIFRFIQCINDCLSSLLNRNKITVQRYKSHFQVVEERFSVIRSVGINHHGAVLLLSADGKRAVTVISAEVRIGNTNFCQIGREDNFFFNHRESDDLVNVFLEVGILSCQQVKQLMGYKVFQICIRSFLQRMLTDGNPVYAGVGLCITFFFLGSFYKDDFFREIEVVTLFLDFCIQTFHCLADTLFFSVTPVECLFHGKLQQL